MTSVDYGDSIWAPAIVVAGPFFDSFNPSFPTVPIGRQLNRTTDYNPQERKIGKSATTGKPTVT